LLYAAGELIGALMMFLYLDLVGSRWEAESRSLRHSFCRSKQQFLRLPTAKRLL
jgi:hypothetical protein